MTSMMIAIIRRDVRLGWQQGAHAVPIAFVLLVATLFAFSVGPDRAVMMKMAHGVVWTAALLAALLPIDRLVRPDADAGFLTQYAVRDISEEQVAIAKWLAHWCGFGPAILIAALPALALMQGNLAQAGQLLAALTLATAGLAALSLMVAALTASIRGSAALNGLLLLPLAVPILIFGAGTGDPVDGPAALKLLAAAVLFIVAVSPFATAAALRGLRR